MIRALVVRICRGQLIQMAAENAAAVVVVWRNSREWCCMKRLAFVRWEFKLWSMGRARTSRSRGQALCPAISTISMVCFGALLLLAVLSFLSGRLLDMEDSRKLSESRSGPVFQFDDEDATVRVFGLNPKPNSSLLLAFDSGNKSFLNLFEVFASVQSWGKSIGAFFVKWLRRQYSTLSAWPKA